ncbi:MAG: hypothetical protein COB15_02035 [Flavobacteriales bacterium]|nr:MAG: hypothetical protein COB15_02035 [Flavobacteriales bacterium]
MKNTQILIALITISSLTILNSCSSGTENAPKETTTEETPIAEEAPSCPTDDKATVRWQTSDTDTVANILSGGNKFSFTLTSSTDAIIAKASLNSAGQFGFYIINSSNDSCIAYSTLNSTMDTLSGIDLTNEHNKHAISIDTANTRINRWKDDASRATWISNNNTSIFHYFVIDAIDITYGENHDCYLSLRYSTTYPDNGPVADLIIVNTETGLILNKTVNLEDLVTPSPPYHYYK